MFCSIKNCFALLAMLVAATIFTVGCNDPGTATGTEGKAAASDDHDHDHDHAHDHPAHGPNGGHMVPLATEEFQAEWKKYNDSNITRIYLLDKSGKEAMPMKLDSFVIKPQAGNDDSVMFELEAEEPNDEGLAAVYMLDDEQLKIAIPLGVNIEIKMGDKTVTGEIKAHEPLDH